MSSLVDVRTCVVVPNWNGLESLSDCLDSLLGQTLKTHVVVVDNGSVDGSVELIESKYPQIELIKHSKNLGFAGGVNAGFRRALELGMDYAASFNNDAVADARWLEELAGFLQNNEGVGIACCKLLDAEGKSLDSTGDYYTVWGLPYPRGRGEAELNKYDSETNVFGASGGASLYRVKTLESVGLFDEKFFAYYEDVDLSFRAQLAGWKVAYVPASVAYHKIGATSSRIKGFTVYQTLKNLPLLLIKNVPRKYFWKVAWRYLLVHNLFVLRAISRGQIWPVVKGQLMACWLLPYSVLKRKTIAQNKVVSDEYIWQIMQHDLPPNAVALRKLRLSWWKLRLKKQAS